MTKFIKKKATINERQQKHGRDLDTKLELEDRSVKSPYNEAQNQGDRKI